MRVLPLSVSILLFAGSVAAKPEHFRIDPVHTRVAFQVSHAGFSNPIATFSKVQGELDFDPDDVAADRVDVRIPIATLELGDADWQGKILDGTFFNAKKFPEARFVSTKVEKTDDNHYTIDGNLSLHGVTQPVRLQATLNALKRHPLTFRRSIGFSATATLKRSAFGMKAWSSVVGDDVKVLIEVEGQRASRTGEPDTSEDADATPQQ